MSSPPRFLLRQLMLKTRHTYLIILLVFLAGCTTTGIPSGSVILRKIDMTYSRDEFISLDEGRRYACFLRLGGKDEDVVDGSFVVTVGFQGPHSGSGEIAFIKPSLKADVGDIVEMETYAIRERNVITRIRQKKGYSGPCRFVTNRFLWNTAEDLYCDGIELEGWQKVSGSYGTWFKPPWNWKPQDGSKEKR